MTIPLAPNGQVAVRLDEVARLLEQQRANPFRVQAYRRAAEALRGFERPVNEILQEEGLEGLERLPAVGNTIARAIRTLVETGRLPMLDRLRGETDAVALLMSVPGVGRSTAERLHHDFGIDSLEDLEAAAHDGRLARVRPPPPTAAAEPPVAELLSVDREYRSKAARGELPTIAPRRFNPRRDAWLPLLHATRGDRQYTALFSNTARAHELGRTHDWVVVYVDGGRGERQYTVVTARLGALKGRRVVRGRETECARYFQSRRHRNAAEQPPEQAELIAEAS